jgi:L-lactate dehydrogenase complex protein LldF
MSDPLLKTLKDRIRVALADPQKQDFLYGAMKRGRDNRTETLRRIPGGTAFRAEVKKVKDRCRDDHDRLLQEFVTKAEARGVKVFLAKTGPDAITYVLELARARNAKTISKSKSLTTEEIELNHPLEEAGLRVVETDLGELIIQLIGDKPYHLVFPSVHVTAKEVSKIFEKETGGPVSDDIDEIMRVVRKYLRPIFLNTDIGMTGANVGIAETGGIVIETNEGNARLVSSIGNCHVCVMGSEKIVETLDEALLMVMAHPVSATGQLPTTYVTWMHGRSPMGEGSQERESHIVILDNGRTEMREDPLMADALNCIRCGACMNICPTYGVVGGHTFGHIYPGPIGIPWTAQVHGLDKAAAFAPLCISCGLCKEICPAQIDMPNMIAEVKHRHMQEAGCSKVDRAMMAADRFAALGSLTAPLSNWTLQNPAFRWLLEKVVGVDRRRALPAFNRRPLAKRFAARKVAPVAQPKHRVAFFVDVFANYNAPDLGMAAIERLEAEGCLVEWPQQQPSGYPFIAYGDLERARKAARYNVSRLAPLARKGYIIVSPEPTAAYTLSKSYPVLLPGDEDAKLVAAQTRELFTFLLEIETSSEERPLEGRLFGFHCSCHQRPLGVGEAAMEWLRRRGAEVQLVETGTCCGMGGTFGLKAGPLGYELSQAVGKNLFNAFAESGVREILTESSVCAIQLREGTGLPVRHPLDLLREI